MSNIFKFSFLLIIYSFTWTLYCQWTLHQLPTTEPLTDVYFSDSLNGWIAGYGGIFHSTDGGLTWTKQIDVYARYLGGINAQNCWATLANHVNGDTILHTSNGGTTWIRYPLDTVPSGSRIYDVGRICFIDSSFGWIPVFTKDYQSWILKTTDGGLTWESKSTFNLFPKFCSFVDREYGWVVGDNSDIGYTRDGGETWDSVYIETYPFKMDLQFIDRKVGWFSNDGPVISTLLYGTVDSGKTWEVKKDFQCSALKTYIFFIDTLEGWITYYTCVDDAGLGVIHTIDGGRSWEVQFQGGQAISFLPRRIFFIDRLHGWVVGDYGLILRTINGGVTSIISNEINLIPNYFSLQQNYPNPFNPQTRIKYETSEKSNIQIKIYNTIGQEIRLLVNEIKEPGSFYIDWDGTDDYGQIVSSGVYYYQIIITNSSDRFSSTRKLIIVR